MAWDTSVIQISYCSTKLVLLFDTPNEHIWSRIIRNLLRKLPYLENKGHQRSNRRWPWVSFCSVYNFVHVYQFSYFLRKMHDSTIFTCLAAPLSDIYRSKRTMSDQNLLWSDILAIEIIRTRLNAWQFLDWSDILSDHFRKIIIPTVCIRTYVY